MPPDPSKLRELAAWFREFAERADNPVIGEARLLMAEDLETEATRIEHTLALHPETEIFDD